MYSLRLNVNGIISYTTCSTKNEKINKLLKNQIALSFFEQILYLKIEYVNHSASNKIRIMNIILNCLNKTVWCPPTQRV